MEIKFIPVYKIHTICNIHSHPHKATCPRTKWPAESFTCWVILALFAGENANDLQMVCELSGASGLLPLESYLQLIYIILKTVYIKMWLSLIQNCIFPLTSFYSIAVFPSLLRSPVTRPCVNRNLIWLWTERCWTLLVVEQQASFLQHQGEAVLPVSLCMEQRPGIPQGFKLQRDDFLPRRARPHAQSVDQAAAAIKAGHIMSCGIEGGGRGITNAKTYLDSIFWIAVDMWTER